MDTRLENIESRSAGARVVKSVMGGHGWSIERNRKEAYSSGGVGFSFWKGGAGKF
jgi:hypothetical protein